jgi:hypothetical protein
MTGRRLPRSRLIQVGLGLTALALAALYLHDRGQRGPAEPPLPPSPLARGQGAQVMRIERLASPPGQPADSASGAVVGIVLERQDPFWRLRAPVHDLASSQTVGELLRAIEELSIERYLEQGELADFGLSPPRHRLVLIGRGSQRLEIDVGDYTSSGLEVYARWSGLEGIAIVSRYLKTRFLDSDLGPWREHELLPPRPATIDSVTIDLPHQPHGRLRLQRLDHKVWRFLSPADREADGSACERATSSFWRFPFTEFVDDPRHWDGLGLDPPRAVWTVYRLGDVDTLLIGAQLGGGQMAARLRGRAPGIAGDELYALLTGGLEALEARGLFRGQARDQRVVAIAGEGTGRAFRLRAHEWTARDLGSREISLVAAGQLPDTAGGDWSAVRDPALAGDLTNLLAVTGEHWADPLARPADPARDAAPAAIHLWAADGTHAWALLYPDDPTVLGRLAQASPGGAPLAGPPAFRGRAVGSAQAARPMQIDSPAVFNWLLRLLRPLPPVSPEPRAPDGPRERP